MNNVPIIASVTPNKTKFGPLLYPGELEKAIRELGEFGYDGIELSLRTINDFKKEELRNQLDKSHLRLISVATGQSYIEDGFSLFDKDLEVRNKTVERLCSFIDLVEDFGGLTVILGGIKGKLTESSIDSQIAGGTKAIEKCLMYAEKKKVILLLEAINRYETNIMLTLGSAVEFASKYNSRYLKVLGDTFHMNIEEISIKKALDDSNKFLGAIHCADSNRLAPGMGHVDFAEVLDKLDNYQSLQYLGVEVLPLPDSSTSAKKAIETIKKVTRG